MYCDDFSSLGAAVHFNSSAFERETNLCGQRADMSDHALSLSFSRGAGFLSRFVAQTAVALSVCGMRPSLRACKDQQQHAFAHVPNTASRHRWKKKNGVLTSDSHLCAMATFSSDGEATDNKKTRNEIKNTETIMKNTENRSRTCINRKVAPSPLRKVSNKWATGSRECHTYNVNYHQADKRTF